METLISDPTVAEEPAPSIPDARGPANGGFPEPPPGDPVRVVRAQHRACGRETGVRLPADLPTGVVQRVVCQSCAQTFQVPAAAEVEVLERAPEVEVSEPTAEVAVSEAGAEVAVSEPGGEVDALEPLPPEAAPPATSPPTSGGRLGWLRDPRSRTWRYLSIPVAAIAVVAILLAIQGEDEPEVAFEPTPAAEEPPTPAEPTSGGQGAAAGASELVSESSFSLALPPGWKRTSAPAGATFAAAAPEGDADATLWVEENPKLEFSDFETQSLEELESLAGSATVVERTAAPTADATIVKLAADAPEGSPSYEVTLRASGPYRYYLSTTAQPDAAPETLAAIQLLHGSFLPTGALPEGSG